MGKIAPSPVPGGTEIPEIKITIATDGSVIQATCTPGLERDTAKVLAGIEDDVSCVLHWHPPSANPDETQRDTVRTFVRLAAELETERTS